jgi:hypothetical protein
MVLTFLVGASLAYLTAMNIRDGLTDRRLVEHGIPAIATLVDVNGNGDPRKTVAMHGPTEDRTVHLSYKDANGNAIDSPLRALENPLSDGKHPGQTIAIRYDPDQPDSWIDRTETQPWVARLTIVWMLLPAVLVAVLMLLLRRYQMLRVWRDGVEVTGTVVELHHSSIAPRSRIVRFTLGDPADRRIFSTFFPNSAGEINKGDELLLLTLPANPSRAIVAELYEE